MTHALENDFLRISVKDDGAELCSIYDKINQREVLWQADPAFWKRHAPVLFPNVGRNYKDCWRMNGREFSSKQHGFARDSVFACVKEDGCSITHELKASTETLEKYPFAFVLRITHILKGQEITVRWEVLNQDKETMYFTIGGHPAFCVPAGGEGKQEDYSLYFEDQNSLTYLLLDPSSGTAVTEQTYTMSLENGTFPITTHMFDKDALVFSGAQIQKAGILMPDKTPYLELRCEGFPNFGIWSVPGAPFVCLEPWMGRCDDRGFEGELSEKENINKLAPGEMFEKEYQIRIFQNK